MSFRYIFTVMVCVASLYAGAVSAQEAVEELDTQSEYLTEQMGEIMRRGTPEEARHFAAIYTNYNLYSVVKAVREDVGNASEACATNNPSIADKVNGRFNKWSDNVTAKMDEVYANIENMMKAQNYATEKQLTDLFAVVDDERAKNSSRFEKTPVSSPEACEFMMSKMDETERSMTALLSAAKMSFPSVLKKMQK